MNQARLEWIMSGLNQHVLTKAEDQFLKTASEDFIKTQALTRRQEERLETLYKEKSQSVPDKDRFAFRKSGPKKTKHMRPSLKYLDTYYFG
jgi:hypothetical protein